MKIKHKILDHAKYIGSDDFDKFSFTIFDKRLKQAKLTTSKDLGTPEQRADKNKEKIFFPGKNFW